MTIPDAWASFDSAVIPPDALPVQHDEKHAFLYEFSDRCSKEQK